MLAKTGLLIVSNPAQIGKILSKAEKQVKNTLYIQLLSALSEPFGSFHNNVFNSWPKYSKTIFGIYHQAAQHCQNLDVRVLLSGIKNKDMPQIITQNPVDLIIFDKTYNHLEVLSFVSSKVGNIQADYDVKIWDAENFVPIATDNQEGADKRIKHAVLGGTFDRLHLAHKVLLSEAALRSNQKLTVGVTEENMLQKKILWELIQDIDTRMEGVKTFLKDICPELECNIVPISDPFGPAITDPTMDLIVVSEETVSGAQKINEIRETGDMQKLEVVPVPIIDDPETTEIEEPKISSSNNRIRLLGTLLKPVKRNDLIPSKPYVIGLTGGIASGKSSISHYLEKYGALRIECDKCAHELYKPGKPCYNELVEHFGESIILPNGEINRGVLGARVFGNEKELAYLNALLWPRIRELVQDIIKNASNDVVLVEASELLRAGWQNFYHEIWATVIPRKTAIERVVERNKQTEEMAAHRIDAQTLNSEYVKAAHVVFCTLWDKKYTHKQVDKAWAELRLRLPFESVVGEK